MSNNSVRWLIAACLGHALVVTLLWILMFKFDIELIPGKIWMGLGLAWPLWVFAALLVPRGTIKTLAVALVLGIVVLIPSIPTLYTFVDWTISGFAP